MSINRRAFLTTSSMLVAAGALRDLPALAQTAPPPANPVFRDLRNGVGIFLARGGTIGWAASPDALVVVDSQFMDTAAMCLEGLKQRSSRQIDALINTHHHGDHTGGNAAFRPATKMIVAHERVPELQKKQAASGPAASVPQAYPDTTFKDSWRQSFGNVTVAATHRGPGHTGGDAVVVFEDANVAHMGDLMFYRRHPRIDRPAGASVRGWITFLEQTTAALDNDTMYIAGHAKDGLDVVVRKADILFFRDYFSAVLDHVGKGIAQRKSKEEVVSLKALPGFEDFQENPPMLTLASALTVAYEELTS